jgi:hypothetical protein
MNAKGRKEERSRKKNKIIEKTEGEKLNEAI